MIENLMASATSVSVLVLLALATERWLPPRLAALFWLACLGRGLLLTKFQVHFGAVSNNVVLNYLNGSNTIAQVSPGSQWELWWQTYGLLSLWLMGCLVIATVFVFFQIRLSKKVKMSAVPADAALCALLSTAGSRICYGRVPKLVVSTAFPAPFVLGFVHPTIVIPWQMAQNFSTSEMEMVFLHELHHLKNRDGLSNFIATTALCVQWFNPFAWLAAVRLAAAQERAVDAAVLKVPQVQTSVYFQTLMHALGACTTAPIFISSFVEGKKLMKRRVQMVYAQWKCSLRFCVLVGLSSLVILGASAWSLVAVSQSSEENNRKFTLKIETEIKQPNGNSTSSGTLCVGETENPWELQNSSEIKYKVWLSAKQSGSEIALGMRLMEQKTGRTEELIAAPNMTVKTGEQATFEEKIGKNASIRVGVVASKGCAQVQRKTAADKITCDIKMPAESVTQSILKMAAQCLHANVTVSKEIGQKIWGSNFYFNGKSTELPSVLKKVLAEKGYTLEVEANGDFRVQ